MTDEASGGLAVTGGFVRLVACVVVASALHFPWISQAEPVPPNLRSALLLRSLAYDHNLADRAGDTLTIVLLQDASEGAEPLAASLREYAVRTSVGGLPFRVVTHRYESIEELVNVLRNERAAVLCVAAELDALIAELVPVVEAMRITLVGTDGADMPNGCALGFDVADGAPGIVVDTVRAHAAGMELDERLLAVARVL